MDMLRRATISGARSVRGRALAQAHKPKITALRDISIEELNQWSADLPPTVLKRARHVVTENQRVLDSVAALDAGDLKRFGQLMNGIAHQHARRL